MRKEYNPIEVSYGVDIEQTPSLQEAKTEQVKVEQSIGKQESTPSKPKSIFKEIEEMKSKGLTRTPEFKEKMKELESILGVNEVNPFGTNELDIFEEKVKEMNLSDMQKLAQRVGLNPYHDRPTLKKILIKEFIATNKNNRRNITPSASKAVKVDPNHPDYHKIQKILGEF